MSDWFETTEGIYGRAWDVLTAGLSLRDAPARQPAFATVSPTGWPEVRTVVLRGVDPKRRTVEVHTDLYSDKIASLRAHPKAALLIWEPKDDLQIRLQANVTVAHGDDVATFWQKVPDPNRQSYGVVPSPGTVIADALDYRKSPDPATFAVLTCAVDAIDIVQLGANHRRIRFTQAGDWQGEWLAP